MTPTNKKATCRSCIFNIRTDPMYFYKREASMGTEYTIQSCTCKQSKYYHIVTIGAGMVCDKHKDTYDTGTLGNKVSRVENYF